MTPRNTQLGASANAVRATPSRGARGASSSASRSTTASARASRAGSDAPARRKGRAGTRTPSTRAAGSSAGAKSKNAARRDSAPRRGSYAGRWWLLPLLVLGVLGLFVFAYYPVARVQYRETRQEAELRSQLTAIRQRNARLRTQVTRLKTPEGVEDYARLRLGLVKKGEHVVVVTDNETTSTAVAVAVPRIDSQEAAALPQAGPWTAFLDAIFGVQ